MLSGFTWQPRPGVLPESEYPLGPRLGPIHEDLFDPAQVGLELIVLRSDPMPEMGMHEPTITRVELQNTGGRTRMTLTDGPHPENGHA